MKQIDEHRIKIDALDKSIEIVNEKVVKLFKWVIIIGGIVAFLLIWAWISTHN